LLAVHVEPNAVESSMVVVLVQMWLPDTSVGFAGRSYVRVAVLDPISKITPVRLSPCWMVRGVVVFVKTSVSVFGFVVVFRVNWTCPDTVIVGCSGLEPVPEQVSAADAGAAPSVIPMTAIPAMNRNLRSLREPTLRVSVVFFIGATSYCDSDISESPALLETGTVTFRLSAP